MRQGRTGGACVPDLSHERQLAGRAEKAWQAAGLERITLHECRHTYASFLMAAGYTLKEIMEFMGHADLQMVQRYVKLLPQPEELNPADRLNAYLRRARSTADEVARVLAHPALELRRWHEHELPARNHLDERLHAPLERVDADPERGGCLLPSQREARHRA